jgi:hypothetical protein
MAVIELVEEVDFSAKPGKETAAPVAETEPVVAPQPDEETAGASDEETPDAPQVEEDAREEEAEATTDEAVDAADPVDPDTGDVQTAEASTPEDDARA